MSNQETFFRSHLKVDLKNVSMIACVDSGEKFVGGLGGEGGICILINTEHRLTNAEFRSGILVLKSSLGIRSTFFSFPTLRSAIGTTDIVTLDFNPGARGHGDVGEVGGPDQPWLIAKRHTVHQTPIIFSIPLNLQSFSLLLSHHLTTKHYGYPDITHQEAAIFVSSYFRFASYAYILLLLSGHYLIFL